MRVETPSVLLIYTGGTIGMIENPETGALENFNFDHLLKHVPELKRFNYRISSYQFEPPLDSSDMEPAYWAKLVKIINYNYDHFDGFVILHGTDTMAYTASALSFMLENLSKPVILTGSQLPIGTLRTDGKENLITAIEIAAAKNPDGIKVIMLITPETSEERVREIDAHTDGFIYMVSSAATTGAQQDFNEQKRAYFKKIEDMNLRNPLMVGFGISNKATFQAACEHASGAIIGSRFVTLLEEEKDPEKAILKLKNALK